jgi:uncharacterized membrane protein YfcA
MKPDKATLAVRFGCGALLGAVVGIGIAGQVLDADHPAAWLIVCLVSMLLLGYGAAKGGDEFWHWIGKRWWWF